MSNHYPPPPGVDGKHRSNASRYGDMHPPAPPGGHRPPPPPSFAAPPPPPPAAHHQTNRSSNYDSYSSNRFNDADRDRGRNDRARDWNRSDRYGRNDRNDRDSRGDRYQPARRTDSYPLPPRPRDSYNELRGGDDSFRPPQGDFTFRADKPSGVADFSNGYQDSYRPSNNGSRAPPRGTAGGAQAAGRGRGGRTGRPPMRRGGWKPFRPSERALLQNNGNGQTTEDFADEENGPTFRAMDDLSDSEEAEMEISDSDNQSGQPTAKRARTTTKPDDGDSAPKWSNPDPYTALPPVEDAEKKKKDVVQLIRKARVESSGPRSSLAAPPADQDFLRFDSDSDDADSDSEDFIEPLTYGRSPASAPSGATSSQGAGNAPPTTMHHPLPKKPGFAPTSTSGQVASQPAAQNVANGTGREKRVLIDLTNSPNNPVKSRQAAVHVDLTQSSDLGTRKRTHDDVLKLPAHAYLKDASKAPVGGNLASEWRPKPRESSCPWVRDTTSQTQINVRLHMEVVDFYEHIKPRQFEDRLRAKLVDDLNKVVSARLSGWNDYLIYPFGSYMSGLYLPTGDMDLAFCSKTYVDGGVQRVPSKSQMRRFGEFIRYQYLAADNHVQQILKARVPLVKYVDRETGLKVDVSFENTSGLVAINTFNTWKAQWPVMPILVTVIKQYLLMRGLNEPVNGGIGGFSVICMVVSMLQNMPQIQSGDMDQSHDLGSLLMHFFDLYGNRFNYENVALSLNPPGYIAKSRVRDFAYKNHDRISIIDPNNPSNDIAGGSHNFPKIVACFSQAHQLLRERLQRIAAGERFDSILDVVLGGNYSSFQEQRNYLRRLHEKIHGYCDE